MFCFGRGAAEEGDQGTGAAVERPPSPRPPPWTNAEDVVSEISSDGKYEIDIPTVKEFTLANLENLRFIDSDNLDGDSLNDTREDFEKPNDADDLDELCDSPSDSLIRDTIIKISPGHEGRFVWSSAKCTSLNNSRCNLSSLPEALGREKIIDNLSGEKVGAKGPASIADLADRLKGQHPNISNMFARQESDDSTASTAELTDPFESASSRVAAPLPPPGPRFKLMLEGDIQVCQLNHTRALISKILSSKFLRRWETHHLVLGDIAITCEPPCGFLYPPLTYTSMEEVYTISRWDDNHKYCLRIVIRDGSLILQAKNAYTRDQWYHSIQWKRNIYKFRNILSQSTRKEVILKELKNMVDFVMTTPLQDESITSEPLEIISNLLNEENRWCDGGECNDTALLAAGPLLSSAPLPSHLAATLALYCRRRPRSPRLRDTLAHIAARILKHNVDFGKAPHLRRLVQEYISALYHQNDGEEVVRAWVRSVHGPGPICPHPRVLPNLTAACLAALHQPLITDFQSISTPATATPPSKSSRPPTPITSSLAVTPLTVSLPITPISPSPPSTRKISESLNTPPSSPKTYSSKTPPIASETEPLTFSSPSTLGTIPTISYTPPLSPMKESESQDDEEIKNNIFNIKSQNEKNDMNTFSAQNMTMDSFAEVKEKNYLSLQNGESDIADESDLICFASVIKFMSEYVDWAEGLGALLQPVPVPSRALCHNVAGRILASAVGQLGRDPRCAVHRRVLPLRHPRPGWFHLLCPTQPGVPGDHAQIWGDMLETLLNCCCKRKRFMTDLTQMLPACLLLALRAHPAGLEALCLMLEWELLGDEQQRLEAVQALRSSAPGRRALNQTCQKQVHLKKLQQKGGPRRLTLPSTATDADVARLLSAGSFGNLECLSLAFTHVTSAVAEELIKLPALRYLNLWATQFGDAGVLLIAEHLHQLQVLNLCETPVSDNGIAALAAIPTLRKLNLNSTKLTAGTWARLRESLPALQESDVRYTDAW